MSNKMEWLAPATILVLLAGVGALGYVIVYRMPDIEKKFDGFEKEQRKQFSDLQVEQRERFRSIDAQLLGVRTNLLRLCARQGRLEKDCQLKEIISVASDVGSFQSQYIAKMSNMNGGRPEVVSAQAEILLNALAKFPEGHVTAQGAQIADAIVWAAAAKDASWTSEGNDLNVAFSNGNVVFTVENTASPSDVAKVASAMNDLSKSFRLVTQAAQSGDSSKNSSGSP